MNEEGVQEMEGEVNEVNEEGVKEMEDEENEARRRRRKRSWINRSVKGRESKKKI